METMTKEDQKPPIPPTSITMEVPQEDRQRIRFFFRVDGRTDSDICVSISAAARDQLTQYNPTSVGVALSNVVATAIKEHWLQIKREAK